MNIFAQSLGLISESDQLSLSEGLHVTNQYLIDTAVGAHHYLQPKAERLFIAMQSPIASGEFLSLAFALRISETQLSELIGFLDSIGGIKITRSKKQSVAICINRFGYRLRGVKLRVMARRYEATSAGLSRLILRSLVPIVLFIIIGLVLAYGANLLTIQFVISQVVFVLVLFISIYIHEAVHCYLAAILGADTMLIARGLRIGMLHSHLSNTQELITALAGPLAGSASALSIAVILRLINCPVVVVLSAAVIAIFHLVSLLPVYGDGIAIQKYWRSRYASAS